MVTLPKAQIEQLVRDNMGLIRSIVAKVMRTYSQLPGGYDRDDLESFGMIGLIQAAQTYDPERGVQFSTYAYRCIENAISGPLTRARRSQVDCISLSVLIGEEEDTPMEDQLFSKAAEGSEYKDRSMSLSAETAVLGQEASDVLKAAVEELPPPHDAVIQKMYFEGKSLSDVARELQLSSQRVQYLHGRALRMLRRQVRSLR
jgi:RNA polymerase sigma factor (sigma-70 family)